MLRPFSTQAYGLGSIFVVDPLYTLPLLVGLVLCHKSFAGLRGNQIGLLLSSLYPAWSVLAQQYVSGIAQASLAAQRSAAQPRSCWCLSDLRMGSEGRYSFRFLLGSPADLAAGAGQRRAVGHAAAPDAQ